MAAGRRVLIGSVMFGLLFSPAIPFLARAAGAEPVAIQEVVVDQETEAVIKGALRYLAAKQAPNGSWNEQNHPIALTGYTLMPFLATGNLATEGEYAKVVAAGVQYLVDSIQQDGTYVPHNDGQYMYGHGIATIALSEMYGQSKSQLIRPKLEKAVRLIISSQNKQGGWRYRPHSDDADISVTVLQVVALRAAKNAGLDVPQTTIDRAVQYVRQCYHAQSGGFGYQPGQGAGFARTAAAFYSLQVCGLYDDPMVKTASDFLLKNKDSGEWFTYGNFYAAPAQYMVGGEIWQQWYAHMNALLMKAVKREGPVAHWDTGLDKSGQPVGPVYCTAVYTTILAMPYHYIPLYQR